MISGSPLGWKQLLDLGESLLQQTSLPAQQELIRQKVKDLLGGTVHLWLSEPQHPLPGETDTSHTCKDDMTDMMRAACDQKQMIFGPSSDTPNPNHIHGAEILSIAVPLIAQGIILGILQIDRPENNPFSDQELDYIEGLAAHASVAIQTNRQVIVKNWRFEQLSLVRKVSAQIANVLDVDELARRISSLIQNTFKYYYVAIYTHDPGSNILRFRACAGPQAAALRQKPLMLHLGEGMVGNTAQSGTEILAADIKQEPRYRYVDALPETLSEASFPLKIENRVLGVLDVQSNLLDNFHEMDVLVLHALADNIAIALEEARLYDNLLKRADQLAAVSEVGRALTSILDLDTLLEEVVSLIHKRFGYPFIHVFTVHPTRRKIIFRAGSGHRSEEFKHLELAFDLDAPKGIVSWVAREGKTLVANDVSSEPLYLPSELPPDETLSEMAVPFVFGGEVLGVLDVQSDQLGAFETHDVDLFEALGDNISISIRNATLYQSEKWRRQVAESLRDVAGLLSAEVALDQVLNAILKELNRNLPCDATAIWLIDGSTSSLEIESQKPKLHLAAVNGVESGKMVTALENNPSAYEWLVEAMTQPTPVIRDPQDPFGPLGVALGLPNDYSSIAAPLRSSDHPLGVLTLAHHTPGRYGNESRAITTTFGSYASIAIENNQLFASSQEQAWVATVMLQVAEASQSITNTDELLSTIVRLTPLLVGIKGCALFTWDPAKESFQLASAYGIHPLHEQEFAKTVILPGTAPAFDELRFGKTSVYIQDVQRDLNLSAESAAELGINSFILLPLLARGEILGAFLVEHRPRTLYGTQAESTDDRRLAILQGITQQTSIAVENIRLLEAKQEEAYVTAVLLQVAQAVVGYNDLNDIVDAIIHILPILVGIDNAIFYFWDADRLLFKPSHVYTGHLTTEKNLLDHLFEPGDFPILDLVRNKDKPLVMSLPDNFAAPDHWQDMTIIKGLPTPKEMFNHPEPLLMAFPLSVKGDVFGVMITSEDTSAHHFRERRFEILTGIAQQVALAIQNDRLKHEMVGRERLEREFQLAREIQQTFLPNELPKIKLWDMDVRWRPARQVGGDFYDLFDLPGGKLGVVIADVSDKGMPAALYMTVTRTLIRAAALEGGSPAMTLAHVNELLLSETHNGMFITTFYAILDPISGNLVYANAGHNIPIILRFEDTQIEKLERGGIALGAIDEIHLEDKQIRLLTGDCLFMYTDGVTEAFAPDGSIFGESRLMDILTNTCCRSAETLLDEIDTALVQFQGNLPASDDVTMLALRHA